MKIQLKNFETSPNITNSSVLQKKDIVHMVNNRGNNVHITYDDNNIVLRYDEENGILAVLREFDEVDNNIPIYDVSLNKTNKWIAKFLDNNFYLMTYYKDNEIEWWREYDENNEVIYYKSSTGYEEKRFLNTISGEYEYVTEIDNENKEKNEELSLSELWHNDILELSEMATNVSDILKSMDKILQNYIDTNGDPVYQINAALLTIDDINILLEETNNYYNQEQISED